MCRLGTGTLKEPMAARDHVNGGTAGEAGGGMSEAKVLQGTSPQLPSHSEVRYGRGVRSERSERSPSPVIPSST